MARSYMARRSWVSISRKPFHIRGGSGAEGQKTGFFLDQRENRERVEKLAASKSVLTSLPIQAASRSTPLVAGQTKLLVSDSSRPALAAAQRHFELKSRISGACCRSARDAAGRCL